ncbi:MAG: DUF952 domain-containing protein [Pseudonocardiaceae bacterium]
MARHPRPAVHARVTLRGRLHPLLPRRTRHSAVASACYRDTPGPLMVPFIEEHKLDATVRWEAACPGPPTGVVAPDTLFPHVYGRINRDAVERMIEVQRDTDAAPSRSRCTHEDRGLDREAPDFS